MLSSSDGKYIGSLWIPGEARLDGPKELIAESGLLGVVPIGRAQEIFLGQRREGKRQDHARDRVQRRSRTSSQGRERSGWSSSS